MKKLLSNKNKSIKNKLKVFGKGGTRISADGHIFQTIFVETEYIRDYQHTISYVGVFTMQFCVFSG